ncbi:MAG TPA: hypothetical protein PKK37_00550 [Candidatus Pacearchaeota archaeon]|jgi:CopG family transcriptional regulator/antitoxin EndoAI|nr:hypothetical protein [Candidatus Pacearchaeota archaeon]
MSTITKNNNHKRIDITLPPETLVLLEKISRKGDRSRLIDEAIRFYVKEKNRAKLRKDLKEGAIKNAKLNLSIAEEWSSLENEAWPKL